MGAKLVVAGAGPLHYLVLIDCAEILASLFDHLLIPFAVRDELIHPAAPKKVKDWILQPRPWLETTPIAQVHPVRGLHKGEIEALQLALEGKAEAILMDDMDGRAAARRLGLSTVFTVAILELAAEKGLIDLGLFQSQDIDRDQTRGRREVDQVGGSKDLAKRPRTIERRCCLRPAS